MKKLLLIIVLFFMFSIDIKASNILPDLDTPNKPVLYNKEGNNITGIFYLNDSVFYLNNEYYDNNEYFLFKYGITKYDMYLEYYVMVNDVSKTSRVKLDTDKIVTANIYNKKIDLSKKNIAIKYRYVMEYVKNNESLIDVSEWSKITNIGIKETKVTLDKIDFIGPPSIKTFNVNGNVVSFSYINDPKTYDLSFYNNYYGYKNKYNFVVEYKLNDNDWIKLNIKNSSKLFEGSRSFELDNINEIKVRVYYEYYINNELVTTSYSREFSNVKTSNIVNEKPVKEKKFNGDNILITVILLISAVVIYFVRKD